MNHVISSVLCLEWDSGLQYKEQEPQGNQLYPWFEEAELGVQKGQSGLNLQDRVLVRMELNRGKVLEICGRSSKSSSNCWSECACGKLSKSRKGTAEKEQREHLWNSYRAGNSAPPGQGGKCTNPKDIREIEDYSEGYCLSSGTNLDLNKDDWIPSHHLNSKPKKPQTISK